MASPADVRQQQPLVTLPPAHSDARGEIQPLVDGHLGSCVLIRSTAGTVRANHYHRTDWHYCYVLSGELDYHHRPAGSSDPPTITRVGAGQMIFTPPMVEHAVVFRTETTLLTLGRNSRERESYESDLVRTELVPSEES